MISSVPIEVFHPYFGYGRVLSTRWAGTLVLVHFDTGLKKWLFSHKLKILKKSKVVRASLKTEKELPLTLQDKKEAMKMAEAFRLGVVPQGHTGNFTFGRDREIEVIQRFLDEFRGGQVLIVDGSYGSGKTHLLDYISYLAINRNFAVSCVELDPFDITPFRPRAFYREITRSLRWVNNKGEVRGFHEFLKALAQDINKIPKLKKHAIFYLAASFIGNKIDVDQTLWNWIEGERFDQKTVSKRGIKFPVLLDYSTSADLYCYLLSGMGFFLNCLGVRGLVVLIDEGENLEDLIYGWQKERGFNFLKGLIMTAKNKKALDTLGELKKRFKSKGVEDAGYEDEMGLIHSRIRPYPYLFENPSHLFVVLSLTPSQWRYIKALRGLVTQREIIHLSPFIEEDYLTIFERLLLLYQMCYPSFSIYTGMKEFLRKFLWTRKHNIRYFIKGTIEGLDLLRHYPSLKKENFLRLGEPFVPHRRF